MKQGDRGMTEELIYVEQLINPFILYVAFCFQAFLKLNPRNDIDNRDKFKKY